MRCSRVHTYATAHADRAFGPQLDAEEPMACRGAVRSRTADNIPARYSVRMAIALVESFVLLILGAVIASIAVVIILRSRAPRGVNGSALGWMSDQWLAEQRTRRST